jgi:hypothetical protein
MNVLLPQWKRDSLETCRLEARAPRCVRAQIAAWVLFCSLSFRRMAFICTFTVDSVITSLRAMILFGRVRKLTSSRRVRFAKMNFK